MGKTAKRLVVPAVTAIAVLAPVMSVAGLLKVEYVHQAAQSAASQNATTDPVFVAPAWSGEFDFDAGPDLLQDSALDPLGLMSYSLDGLVTRQFGPERWSLAGVLAYRYRHATLYGDTYNRRHQLQVGPSWSLTPSLSADLYYRYSQDHYDDELLHAGGWLGDGVSSSLGVAQTWHFAGHRGMVRLGYEVGSGQSDDARLRRESQRLNLSSRIPLFWGLRADLEADLSHNVYPDYAGAGAVSGIRREFRAGLSSSFGDSFEAAIQYRFADEDADVDALSRRYESWGMNLRYTY
jgi:hypothetical protein